MTRVSTAAFYQRSTEAITRAQSQLQTTQLQIASGRRLINPSDDPVATARIAGLDAALAQTDQFQRNANMARTRLATEEQVLTDVQNSLFRIRELAIQANNDTQTVESRRFIATEAKEILGQLLETANRRDAQGNYLFGGYQARTAPFALDNGSVRFDGDQGQRRLQIGQTRYVADGDSGADVFLSVRNGNGQFATTAAAANTGTGIVDAGSLNGMSVWDGSTYTIRFTAAGSYDVLDSGGAVVSSNSFTPGDTVDLPGASVGIEGAPAAGDEFTIAPAGNQDIFTTVQNFVDALDSGVAGEVGNAVLHNQLNNVLSDLDQGIGNVLDVRTKVGSRLHTIETQEESNADLQVTLQATRSELSDLDYAEAITRLNQQMTGLQAAQRSFAQIQGLSLFNVI